MTSSCQLTTNWNYSLAYSRIISNLKGKQALHLAGTANDLLMANLADSLDELPLSDITPDKGSVSD